MLGEYIWEQAGDSADRAVEHGVDNTQECAGMRATLGLEIAIELEPFKLSLVNSVDTMLKFLDEVGMPNVKANCDISHLHLVTNRRQAGAAS